MAVNNPRQFWTKIKQQYKRRDTQTDTLTVHDLHKHFKDLFGSNQDQEARWFRWKYLKWLFGLWCYVRGTKKAIFSQNNNKSSGIDGLIAELYKHSFDSHSHFILEFFNRLFQKGEYPKLWGEGIISPIFKSGNSEDPKKLQRCTPCKRPSENIFKGTNE